MKARVILAPLVVGTWMLSSTALVLAATEFPETGMAEPAVAAAAPEQAAPARTAKDSGVATGTRDVANPPSSMQIAGALGGALVGILLAIAGVTVTFKSMRNEMRRGRGHRRHRSDGTSLPQT